MHSNFKPKSQEINLSLSKQTPKQKIAKDKLSISKFSTDYRTIQKGQEEEEKSPQQEFGPTQKTLKFVDLTNKKQEEILQTPEKRINEGEENVPQAPRKK